MAGTVRTKEELEAQIIATVYANNDREVNATELQTLLLDFNATCFPEPGSGNLTYPTYNPATTYEPGADVYVMFDAVIWQFVSKTPRQGVEPGTDATVWDAIPASELAHIQNTDIRLGTHYVTYEASTATLTIDLTLIPQYNAIRLKKTTGSSTITVVLVGRDIPVDDSEPRPINNNVVRFYVDDYDNNTYLFSGGNFRAKDTISGTQSLTKGQLMQVKTYFSIETDPEDPDVFVCEEFTNKLSDAGATNPFDQSLNTTDSPTLQALTLAQQAGDEGRVLVTGALGQLTTRAGFKVNPAAAATNPNTLVILEHIYSPSWVGAEGAGDKALIVGENGKTKKEDLTPFSSIVLTSFKMIDNLGDTYTVSIVAGTLTLTKDA